MKRLVYAWGLLLCCSGAATAATFVAGHVDFTTGYEMPEKATGYSLHLDKIGWGIPNGEMTRGIDGNQIYVRGEPTYKDLELPLKEGDVILGVNGTPFKGEVIDTWRAAVREAKERSEDGLIHFIRWRAGTREDISMLTFTPVADLTKGETEGLDRQQTWNLGPTGMRGWLYSKFRSNVDLRQGRISKDSRQILVTDIGADSPADGVMKLDDVIIGVDGKRFTADARKSLAQAITEAEKTKNKGKLELLVWRAGKTLDVDLKLDVMGSYSKTAPYNCPKSGKILANACKVLEKELLEKQSSMWGSVNGLALLATGREEYLPAVRTFARSLADREQKKEGGGAWDCGYNNVFLSEYYLLTQDKEVLPAIDVLTKKTARGQSLFGTFGHGFSSLTPEGELHGSIPPYGAVNQAGLIANLGIVMGHKCGIEDPEIVAAIERGNRFFSYFVDKGGIPYGEHVPTMGHGNNGKSALAAVLYAVQGEAWHPERRYYAKLSTAGYNDRECGHTGQGFSYIWSALGANVGGPGAAAAFHRKISWHLDLARRCDGAFSYDGAEQCGPGIKSGEDNTYYGHANYCGLSPTATYVLTYSIPFKTLHITGKAFSPKHRLSRKDVAKAIASGTYDLTRKEQTVKQLVAALGDWSPTARYWAAEELARRPEANDQVPRLIKMAEGKDKYARRGACEALRLIKNEQAVPALARLLKHDDLYMRYLAAGALQDMGEAVRPALNDILTIVIESAKPLKPIDWRDPVQITHNQVTAVAAELLNRSLEGADRRLLHAAIRSVAPGIDLRARETINQVVMNKLSEADVEELAPDLLAALTTQSPNHGFRMASAKALSKYHYREGMKGIVDYAKHIHFHGSQDRVPLLLGMLQPYGAAARDVLPDLRDLLAEYQEPHVHAWAQEMKAEAVEQLIKDIESAADEPELKTVAR